jgi:Tfp pilus assembly protein PilX
MFKEVKTVKNESGFASIVVALTIIIILALLTVAFAQLARREQQTSLDKQLAIQATYAAESGINDVVKYLDKIPLNNDANKCINDPAILPLNSNTVSNSTGASYTCVLVNKHPKDVIFGHVSPQSDRYSTFTASDTLDNMTIQWRSSSNNTTFPSDLTTRFPTKSKWNDGAGHDYPAVVQFYLVPINSLKRDDLINNTFTIYLYPSSSAGGQIDYSAANNGAIVSGACDNTKTYPCSVTINNLNSSHYIVRVQTYYDESTDIRITGSNNTTGSVTTTDQASIDVTGKARNVLKRLQVRVQQDQSGTIYDQPALPNNALEGQNICKRQHTADVSTYNPSGTSFDSLDASCNLLAP